MSDLALARYMYHVDIEAEYQFQINDRVQIARDGLVRIAGQSGFFRNFEGKTGTVIGRDMYWGDSNRENNYEIRLDGPVGHIIFVHVLERFLT